MAALGASESGPIRFCTYPCKLPRELGPWSIVLLIPELVLLGGGALALLFRRASILAAATLAAFIALVFVASALVADNNRIRSLGPSPFFVP